MFFCRRRFLFLLFSASLFSAPLLIFAGCAPKASAPLPGSDFLRAMQQRAATPETQTITNDSLAEPPQPAFIDVSAIAARLPSWKLAAQLEKGGQSVQFSQIGVPDAPRALQIQSSSIEKAPGSLPRPAGENDEPFNATSAFERAPQRVAAREATPLEMQGKQRQEGTLESFLADVARKQNATRNDDKTRLRAELEDEIEASQRLALASLEPLLPSPAVQLEMTNLRIQLLPNSPGSEIEKQEAAARLAQLENQWRTQLRAQADKRFEELRRLLTEVPIEKREAGSKEIEKLLSERGIQDENLRKLVESALRERVAAGFGFDDTAPLFIQLPGAQLAPQTLNALSSAPTTSAKLANGASANTTTQLSKTQINSNTPLLWPSAAAFARNNRSISAVPPHNTPPLSDSQKRAAQLRVQAFTEASRWAKSVARQRNWILQNQRAASKAQSVPDRTSEALQLLNL